MEWQTACARDSRFTPIPQARRSPKLDSLGRAIGVPIERAPEEEIPMSIDTRPRPWAALCIASLIASATLVGCGGGGGSSASGTVSASGAGSTKAVLAENDPSNPIQILSSQPSLV